MTIESGMCGGSGALWYYSNTQWGENICSALWVFTGVFNCLPEGELQTADSWSWWKLEAGSQLPHNWRLRERDVWRHTDNGAQCWSVVVSAELGGELPIIQTFSMVFSDNL